jgi:hypothetical protein
MNGTIEVFLPFQTFEGRLVVIERKEEGEGGRKEAKREREKGGRKDG